MELVKAIDNILPTLPTEFTSHDVIRQLVETNQQTYVKALSEHVECTVPFQALHSKIGKYLASKKSLTLVRRNKVDKNIFGRNSENALWRK